METRVTVRPDRMVGSNRNRELAVPENAETAVRQGGGIGLINSPPFRNERTGNFAWRRQMKLHCIRTGDVQIKSRHKRARRESWPARMLDVLVDREWTPRIPICCWLIDHPEGLILVDTGESSHANDPGYQPWWHPFMHSNERRWVKPEEEVGPRLRALGFDPLDVRWVVMTHMHGDHAGGIGHFPKSDILLSKPEAAASLAPSGPLFGFLNAHYPDWLKPVIVEFNDGPWESFERSAALTGDGRVRIVPTPGHTRGHMSVIADLGDHCALVAGDAFYDEKTLLDGSVDGVAQDARLHRDSTRRIRDLCRRRPTIALCAHDPESVTRLASSIFTKAG
jgi:glyoxylase-like metal-dependent hydrolase (beta-lactamase superfamily II)